jgi:hypothetical protein
VYKMKSKVERLWPQSNSDQHSHASLPLSVGDESKELEELRAKLDEQKLSLVKAEKRINRLIGERSQLSALLEKREKKIDEINRELGKYQSLELGTRRSGADKSRASKWVGQEVAASFNRIRTFVADRSNSFGQVRRDGTASEAESGGRTPIAACIGDGTDKQVVGVLLFGLEKEEVRSLLPSIERDCTSKGLRPLLLVDIDDFEIFRAHGLPFEYIPSPDQRERFDTSLNWDLYLQRRLSIIRKKWDPVKLVAFGARATWTLKLWSASPFEGTPLPDSAAGLGAS